ncbi:MAG: hypothetical protein PUD91_04345 [Bacteroidales bacterium]|nr:hypothetical protein [Bacteroidales bacterium]
MRNTTVLFALLLLIASSVAASAQKVDYSVVTVPEESGTEFMKMTKESDYVCMPLVKRSSSRLDWFTNTIIAVTSDGSSIAYLSSRNNATNIFIKDLSKQGSSMQRTNRQAVLDFSFSPDGKYLCFSEARGKNNCIFQTDARNGYVCRQITSGDNDYSPMYAPDMKTLFFARTEARGVSLWGYNFSSNFVSSYAAGMNPCPLPNSNSLLCTRPSSTGRSEIWRVNYQTGLEECIVSDPNRSFASPRVSPDGKWIVFAGESILHNGTSSYRNTDIFVCRADGTDLTQLTYHAADDLSPAWSADGNYIYFISQRGDADGLANIWRITFNLY